MPKEYTHWMIAGSIADTLPEDIIKGAISAFPRLYFLGSVFPDAAMYYISGPKKDEFKKISDYMHAQDGGNPFRFLKPFFQTINNAINNTDNAGVVAKSVFAQPLVAKAALSFAFGICVHIITDAVFHPLVFYLTGSANTKDLNAIVRHRQFEAELDLYYMAKKRNINKKQSASQEKLNILKKDAKSVKRLYRNIKIPFKYYIKMAHTVFLQAAHITEAETTSCIRQAGRFQNLFLSRFFRLVILAGGAAGLAGKDITEAFYPLYRKSSGFFQKEIIYRHPVTGEEHLTSIESLENECIKKARVYCPEIEKLYQFPNSVADPVGPSPITGIELSKPEQIQYQHPDPDGVIAMVKSTK